ncbi:MAG: DUF2953 domain-containing protein [Methanosarcina sp.]
MPLVAYLLLLVLLVVLLVLFILITAIGLTFKLKVLSVKEDNEFGGIFTIKWLLFSHTFLIGETEKQKVCIEKLSRPEEGKTEEKAEGRKKGIRNAEDQSFTEEFEQREYTSEDFSKEEGEKTKEYLKVEKRESREEKRIIEEKTQIQTIEEVKTKDKAENKEKLKIEKEIKTRETIEVKEVQGKEKRGLLDRIRRKKRPEDKARSEVDGNAEPKPFMTNKEKLHWGIKAFKELRKPLFRLISDVLNGIKIKRLESRVTFGLSDPADTGMLCGSIHAITALIYGRCKHCSFSINPVFMDPMLDLRGKAEIRVRIYSLVFPFLKFISNGKTLSFTYLFLKEIIHRKWKSNS